MNLNKKRDEIQGLRKKIAADLQKLGGMCSEMGNEVSRLYHEEVARADGNPQGLDDYQSLSRSLMKDAAAVNGARSIVTSRVSAASGYDFEELAEEDR